MRKRTEKERMYDLREFRDVFCKIFCGHFRGHKCPDLCPLKNMTVDDMDKITLSDLLEVKR